METDQINSHIATSSCSMEQSKRLSLVVKPLRDRTEGGVNSGGSGKNWIEFCGILWEPDLRFGLGLHVPQPCPCALSLFFSV